MAGLHTKVAVRIKQDRGQGQDRTGQGARAHPGAGTVRFLRGGSVYLTGGGN